MNMANLECFINIAKLMRIREWWTKLLIFFAAAMIMVIWNENTGNFFGSLIFMFVYGVFTGSYGYIINSYFDRRADEQINKYPVVRYFRKNQLILVLAILGSLTFLMPFYFHIPEVAAIGLAIFFLTTFYSAPPLRLKERSILGPLAVAFAHRPLPFLLFTFLIPPNAILTLFLFGWLILIGLPPIIGHQMLDFENDMKTGITTMVTSVGLSTAYKITLSLVCVSFLYILLAPVLFGLVHGFALTLTLFVFAGTDLSFHIFQPKNNIAPDS
jgi:4-hydroxybenzoate polyprenyltransferase